MIELKRGGLVFTFPEIHPRAELTLRFQRTLRIPDDEGTYPLPPGLGDFPLRHVDDYAPHVPAPWLRRGGVMFPMYQSEAMWLHFNSSFIPEHQAEYPFAIKVAAGKRCAITGEPWRDQLQQDPQDYLVAPDQPWIDGFAVEEGLVRQFVAMPLGQGYTAEEQITGDAEFGGLQIAVSPMKRSAFESHYPKQTAGRERIAFGDPGICLSSPSPEMGLAPGGLMRQEIYDDPYRFDEWQIETCSRCFVHLCNSMVWQSITGTAPPHPAPTAKSYNDAGLPWFEYYDDSQSVVGGSETLSKLKSVTGQSTAKAEVVLPENESVSPENVINYRKGLRVEQVREGTF